MKILTGIDVPFQPFGGSLLCCNDWYSDLPNDVEVRFLTLHPPEGQVKWWDIKDIVMLDIIKRRGADEFPRYTAELAEVVREEIDKYRPDVLHCQHLNYGLSRVFAEASIGIPKIGICHGTDVQLATSHPFFLENLKIICDAMDVLVFPNQNMADDCLAVYGKKKEYVINPLGVPDRFYTPQTHPIRFKGAGQLRVLYAGRLLTWKGAHIAVQAMKHITRDIHLTVIGNEDEAGYVNNMQAFVEAHRLKHLVTFKPQLTREKLLKSFDQFDVIVFPSIALEAFSLTVVEAQLKGLPVVFGKAGGIVNTVGDSGVPLSEVTPNALAKALDSIYDHPEMLRDTQKRGFTNAAKYRLSKSQNNLLTISKRLLHPGD